MKTGIWKWATIATVVVTIAGLIIFSSGSVWLQEQLRQILGWIAALGVWGEVLFVLVYAAATVLLIPGSALGLGAGALFGVLRGSCLVSVGSTLGATGAFLLGRHAARDWVARKMEGSTTFASMDGAVAKDGWKIVLLTRLSPLFPFTLLNYAFGLTRVSLASYVVASWIGMLPGTVMYVYLGSLARAGVAGEHRRPVEWALHGIGLLATIAVTIIIARMARRALAKRQCSTS